MYYIFCEEGKLTGAGEAEMLNEDALNISVSVEVYEEFINSPEKFIFSNGEVIENPDYPVIYQKKQLKKRIDEILEHLEILDKKRIRAVCEDEVRDEKTGETWLDFYNSQIYDLRVELNSIEEQL